MTAPLDIAAILSNAGADADAPEGSQAWALAQVAEVVGELVSAHQELLTGVGLNDIPDQVLRNHGNALSHRVLRSRAALARIGGQP